MPLLTALWTAVAFAGSPGVYLPIELNTAGTFPRSVQRVNSAVTDDLLVFANGSDLAPSPLTGFCLDPGSVGSDPPWLPAWASNTALYDFGTAVGDIDGDGLPDLVVASLADVTQVFETGGVRVHYGQAAADGDDCGALLNPDPVWLVGGPGGGGYSVGGVELADLDADGDLDIVVAVLWWAPTDEPPVGASEPQPRLERVRERSLLSGAREAVNLLPGMRGGAIEVPDFDQTCSPGTEGFQNNLLTCMNGRPRVLRNTGKGVRGAKAFPDSGWRADVSGAGGDNSRLGASAALIRDINGDGFLDLFLGSQQWQVFLGTGDASMLSSTPAWSGSAQYGALPVDENGQTVPPSSRYIYDLDYLPAAEDNDFIVASTACIMPEGCDLDSNGYTTLRIDPSNQAGLVQTGVVPAGLWVGSDEFAAAVGVGNIDGDGIADLIGGTWSSMNGTLLSGGPVLFLAGSDTTPSQTPVDDSNPNTLPGASPLPMAADIKVDQLCSTAPGEKASTQHKASGDGLRSVFPIGERSREVLAIDAVWLRPRRNLVAELCPASGAAETCTHTYTVADDRTWISVAPPLDESTFKRLTIEYRTTLVPDILVANSNPTANSALWCHD